MHAHLSGSVRDSTILELLEKNAFEKFERLNGNSVTERGEFILNELKRFPVGERDLDECFKYFAVLHEVLNSREILKRIAREVFEDFRNDNVVYLELRTTPRCIKDPNTGEISVSKVDYVKTLIEVIKEFEKEDAMLIRLIISVDRAKGLEDGLENIQLSQMDELRDYIVGVDFSGNPKSISYKDLHGLFELCGQCNLKVTVHIGEHWQDTDVDFILEEVRPDRIGHAVCLSSEQKAYLHANPIPIEICPTSNMATKLVETVSDHPFYEFYSKDQNYLLIICTDDIGVFNTSLSREYFLISSAFGLGVREMFELNKKAIRTIFDQSLTTVQFLEKKFNEFEQQNFF